MASYLEIKQTLKTILGIKTEITEECDLILEIDLFKIKMPPMIFSNELLKAAFDRMQNYNKEKLELLTSTSREAALQSFEPIYHDKTESKPIIDTINNITYSIGPATLEYCLFLLDALAEKPELCDKRDELESYLRLHRFLQIRASNQDINNPLELLPEILHAYTIKVESGHPVSHTHLKEYASSFEFLVMYRKNIPVSEYADIKDMYSGSIPHYRFPKEEIDSPPQRIYNSAVLDYYSMAMESKDPFTKYISFYHIVEHYFDEVFRKKLTNEIKDMITKPDFSYKSEKNLYELAKYIRKHMSSDDASGKGNEFESLKYVLMEYDPIEKLKERISRLDPNAIAYYQNNFVPFTTSKKTKISWTDSQGVYTNLATRIYETRNALVHSKSEQSGNQYRPYKNRKELSAEIALIRAVAETTLINSSKIL